MQLKACFTCKCTHGRVKFMAFFDRRLFLASSNWTGSFLHIGNFAHLLIWFFEKVLFLWYCIIWIIIFNFFSTKLLFLIVLFLCFLLVCNKKKKEEFFFTWLFNTLAACKYFLLSALECAVEVVLDQFKALFENHFVLVISIKLEKWVFQFEFLFCTSALGH